MQVLKDETREKILRAAKNFFLDNGFERTSMNMIAKEAGVSKSNLYNYFPSKEEIFYHLTDKAYTRIERTFENLFQHDCGEDFDPERFILLMAKELMELLTEYREEILLIVDCSRGTRFEKTKDMFINRMEEHSIRELQQYRSFMKNDDWFFIHYVSTSLIEGLLEIIRHNKSDAWIRNNIKMLVTYYVHGYSHFFADFIS
ncbi:transcriptional regulator, TetR family [Anaerovirgula multivorans]|uniref:Transcriptional regulator, TetR family n=1 Tax=Anaerovirgula multivorans TaxID=312168 RepID=A0A239JKG4_9FIRM|nr:TetR/AcrR family transcriptional regulator [Anaerovirgula multivorans]SNT06371.1 transcriptional regulator, TetR family [Anaerovirgula multivorans]